MSSAKGSTSRPGSNGPGARSSWARLFASATAYQVSALARGGAGAPKAKTWIGPAAPSTALVASQGSGWKVPCTTMSMLLWSDAPHRLAANSNRIRRWSPSVAPVLPPTGAVGVGSLKPMPGSSTLLMRMVAASAATAAAARQARPRSSWRMALLAILGRGGGRLGMLRQREALELARPVGSDAERAVLQVLQADHRGARGVGRARRGFGSRALARDRAGAERCELQSHRGGEALRLLGGERTDAAGVGIDRDRHPAELDLGLLLFGGSRLVAGGHA